MKVNNLQMEEFDKQKQIFTIKYLKHSDRLSSLMYEPFVVKELSEVEEGEVLQEVENPILDWIDKSLVITKSISRRTSSFGKFC